MFTVDGFTWPLPCDITESQTVHSTSISGMLLNGQYFNDVDGTYISYNIRVVIDPDNIGMLYTLYAILTDPVDGHEFVLPHDDTTIHVTARIDGAIERIYRRLPEGATYWTGIKFKITSNGPYKVPDLNATIQRGLTPLPVEYTPQDGDICEYILGHGWVLRT